jgi:low affinity Fe/Cu permease
MIFSIPDITTVVILTALAVWAALEVIKSFFKGWRQKTAVEDRPWYWSGSLRLFALVLGAFVGWQLCEALQPGSSPWGAYIGIGAGAFSATIVALVKKQVRYKLRIQDKDDA